MGAGSLRAHVENAEHIAGEQRAVHEQAPQQPARSWLAVAGWMLLAAVAALPLAQSFFEVTNAVWSPLAFGAVLAVSFVVVAVGAGMWLRLRAGGRVAVCAYALVCAVTALLGGRVVRTEWYYFGHYEDNYMGSFAFSDVYWTFAFALLMLMLALSVMRAYDTAVARFAPPAAARARGAAGRHVQVSAVRHQPVVFVVAWLATFVCWLPYLLAYYPGAIYEDSIVSIEQALGMRDLNDHHPVPYTLFIGLCLRVGNALGSYQLGCAIYTIVQMLAVAAVAAYLVVWLRRHGIARIPLVLVWAYFALLPIFALHAISMWKDAPYAAALLLFALALFDVAESRGAVLRKPTFCVKLALITLGVCFIRNNGVYVAGACWLVMALAYGFRRVGSGRGTTSADGSRGAAREGALDSPDAPDAPGVPEALEAPGASEGARPRRAVAFMLVGACCLAAYAVITGPVYSAAGIPRVPVESYGVPLQQASAVVVYQGEMTDEQRDFMETLLPLDRYAEVYKPCSVDGVKWARGFDTKFFNEHQSEFLQLWAEMMIPNAKIYLDAYVLETYEYWSIGDIQRNGHIDGVNTKATQEELGIVEENRLEQLVGADIAGWFSFSFLYPCEGVIAWFLLFIALYVLLRRNPRFLLALLPALLSWGTVLISAPFAGLQRYALPSAFVLPVAVLLPVLVGVCALCAKQNRTQLGVD